MKRTITLFKITIFLILGILTVIIIKDYDNFKEKILYIKNIYTPKQVKIPATISNSRNYEFKTVKTTDNFEPHNVQDLKNIYYTVLNNGWETFTFYCPDEYETCYEDVMELAKNDEYISLINNYVSSFNQYLRYNTSITNNGEVKLNISKIYSKEETIALKIKIKEILTTFDINPDNIKYQDLRNIQDYIINILSYDEEYKEGEKKSPSSTAYGALSTGKAICSGYTDLYSLFLDELKVPNFKVASENHIWNVVYLKGNWKHVDVTWNDDEINKYNIHNFFMIDTNELLEKDTEEHNFNKSLYLEILNQD